MTKKFYFITDVIRSFLFVALLSSCFGCGSKSGSSDAGELTFTVAEFPRFIIPATDWTCEAIATGKTADPLAKQDLTGPYLTVPPVTYEWKSTTHILTIVGVFIDLKSPLLNSNSYHFMWTGNELAATIPFWYSFSDKNAIIDQRFMFIDAAYILENAKRAAQNPPVPPIVDGRFPQKVSTTDVRSDGVNTFSGCPLKAGGIQVNGVGMISGTLKVLAVATSLDDGAEIPVQATTGVRVQSIIQPTKP